MEPRKKILVAPLGKGFGYATRCIPIIEALENHGFEPIIASNGGALLLLQKEFPHLTTAELPAYHLEYAKPEGLFSLKKVTQLVHMYRAIQKEKKTVAQLVREMDIKGIISDNRPGAYSKKVPSVFITHQVNILQGNLSGIASHMHRSFFWRFTQCWVPDVRTGQNLSGKLGHTEEEIPNLRYIGTLSRLHKTNKDKKYDLAVIISGAEPHRSQLEEKLKPALINYDGNVVLIRGIVETEQTVYYTGHITEYNYMNSTMLEDVLNRSEMVLCRPSYSNIMDLAKLCKRAFFIPVPGNEEQEYLAKKMKKAMMAPYSKQESFKAEHLEKAKMYKGLRDINGLGKWKDLFSLFEGE